MLDKRFILENPDVVQKNCDVRGVKADVHRFARLETECRQLQQEIEELSRQANVVSKSIGAAKDDAERDQRKEEGRALREKKEQKQEEIDRLTAEAGAIYRSMPNLTHPEAPIGGEDHAREIRRGGPEVRKFSFPVLDHVALAEQHDLIDFEGARELRAMGFTF